MKPIKFDHVSKIYPQGTQALVDVSWAVEGGGIAILAGPNGSGKTTALEMLSGLRVPTSGKVYVGPYEARPYGPQRNVTGFQLQGAGLPTRIKVKEAIKTKSILYKDPGPVDELTSRLGLDEYFNTMVDKLSGGWQRRLDVLLATIGQPEYLILDEPTSGLDPVARAELWGFLKELRSLGMAIMVSTHDLAEAQAYGDTLIILHKGKVVLKGTVDQILNESEHQWRIRISHHDQRAEQFLKDRGLKVYSFSEGIFTLGTKHKISETYHALEAAYKNAELSYNEAIHSVVQLEDVFFSSISSQNETVQG